MARHPAKVAPDRARVLARLQGTVPPVDPAADSLQGLTTPISAALARQLRAPARRAAVLVPLVERRGGRLSVTFTERATHLKHHAGQVSFPGGRIECGDAGPVAAALREAHEEIGLAPEDVEVAGYLDAHLTITGFAVTPVVGLIHERSFIPLPDPTEVATVFEVPLDFFMDPANRRRVPREYLGSRFEVVEFEWQNHRIWGATGIIMANLTDILSDIG